MLSELESTTKLVLHTMHAHMNNSSGIAYPSIKTIAKEANLTERCVCDHIQKAEKLGWILVEKKGKQAGQAWKHNVYTAVIPKKGTESASIPLAKRTEHDAEGTEPDDKKVLNHVPTNSLSNSINNSSENPLDKEKKPTQPTAEYKQMVKFIKEGESTAQLTNQLAERLRMKSSSGGR